MFDALKELAKQPFWIVALILGALLIAFPSVTIDKDNTWATHQPTTFIPVIIGAVLLLLASASFGFTLWSSNPTAATDSGLDLSRVKERDGMLWTTVSGCEIRVVEGRIEEYEVEANVAVALPCNEYFDDECARDKRSALGAYLGKKFDGQIDAFLALMRQEAKSSLGEGVERRKTSKETGLSLGVGRCVLLVGPLSKSVTVALVSTTTQRADQGLSGRLSYLFDGMSDLVTRLAEARINEVVMPVLAGGHAGIDPPLAFVGLLLAVAEAARYRSGGGRLKSVTIVVFRADKNSLPQVNDIIVRRALALIASHD